MKRLFELEVPDDWNAVGADWLRRYMVNSCHLASDLHSDIKITEIVATEIPQFEVIQYSACVRLTPLVDEAELRQQIEAANRCIDAHRDSIQKEKGRIYKLNEQLKHQRAPRGESR